MRDGPLKAAANVWRQRRAKRVRCTPGLGAPACLRRLEFEGRWSGTAKRSEPDGNARRLRKCSPRVEARGVVVSNRAHEDGSENGGHYSAGGVFGTMCVPERPQSGH